MSTGDLIGLMLACAALTVIVGMVAFVALDEMNLLTRQARHRRRLEAAERSLRVARQRFAAIHQKLEDPQTTPEERVLLDIYLEAADERASEADALVELRKRELHEEEVRSLTA